MKFDILAESIITSILEEGRKKKSEKFSYISVDGNALKQKIESGELDAAINATLAGRGERQRERYPNIDVEKFKAMLSEVAEYTEEPENKPSTFGDLMDLIETAAHEAYKHKGENRKTLVANLSKALLNVIIDHTDAVKQVAAPPSETEEIEDTEQEPEEKAYKHTLSPEEEKVLEFIGEHKTPVDYDEVIRFIEDELYLHDEEASGIISKLIEKNYVGKNIENKLSISLRSPEESDEEDEANYDPFSASSDVRDTFKRTMATRDYFNDEDLSDPGSGYRLGY
jgi:hypothetical protein